VHFPAFVGDKEEGEPEHLAWLVKLLEFLAKGEPEEVKHRLRMLIIEGSAALRDFAKDIGIDNPKEFAEYVQAGSAVGTVLASLSISESMDRLEGLTGDLVERYDSLLKETRILQLLTGVLAALTTVLVIVTVMR
jgi:hypothetical protein